MDGNILLITLPPVPINHATPVSCQSFLTAAQQMLSSKPTINHVQSSIINPSPHYNHSCYHQRLQSIISPPTAHLSTSNHATAVVMSHALSAQSHRHWLMLPMSVFFFCWTQTALSALADSAVSKCWQICQHIWQLHNFCWHCTLKIAIHRHWLICWRCIYTLYNSAIHLQLPYKQHNHTWTKTLIQSRLTRVYKALLSAGTSVECVRACDKVLNAVAILQWKMSDWLCYPQTSPLPLTDEEILANLNEIERICVQILNQQTSSGKSTITEQRENST